MTKVKITLVVPEQIATLVEYYVQYNLCGSGNPDFKDYLEMSDIDEPGEFMSEMEIGIEHPDDEPVKIMSFLEADHKEVIEYLEEYIEPTYFDKEIGEHLYSVDCLSETVFWPPIEVIELIDSVKVTDCCYFRFQKC